MANIKQYYGIKFPFTANNNDNIMLDLNENNRQKVESDIAHVILTPKNTRIRMPNFGTDLIKYVFEPNESLEWDSVKEEIVTAVKKYVRNVNVENVSILSGEENDEHVLALKITYSYSEGITSSYNDLYIKL